MSIYVLYGIVLQLKLDIYEIVSKLLLYLCNLICVFLLLYHIENFMPNNISTPSRRVAGRSYKVSRSLLFFYFAFAVISEGNATLWRVRGD